MLDNLPPDIKDRVRNILLGNTNQRERENNMEQKKLETLFEYLLSSVETLAAQINALKKSINIDFTIDTLRKIRNVFNDQRTK